MRLFAVVAVAVTLAASPLGAKPCPLSHPYNKTTPCAAVPGCHLTPAPASLHGQLVMFESYTSPGGPPPPVASRTVDYWSWYTPNHEWGWSSVWPRVAKFSGAYLFRAAHTIGDVHRWEPPPPSGPEPIFADGFESGSAAAWSGSVPP